MVSGAPRSSQARSNSVFDFLESDSNHPKTEEEICEGTGLKALRSRDILNALVGMGHMNKDPDTGKYSNTKEGSDFCVKTSPFYFGELFHFRGNALDADYANLTKYLKG